MIIKPFKKTFIPLLFVHIPKNAGGSINDYFNFTEKMRKVFGHKTISQIKKSIYDKDPVYKKIKFEDYFKFTVFRNPWERTLSNFKFRKQEGINDPYWAKVRKLNMSFNDWVKMIADEVGVRVLRKYNSYLSYITINEKIAVDHIINFHNLNKEFKIIKKLCKFKKELGNTAHKSKRKNYKFYYDDNSIDLIKKIHEPDIELFKFDFEKTSKMDLSMIENKCEISKKFI